MLKKRTLITMFLLALSIVCVNGADALQWHTANQTTIQWDAVTELSNGSPIPAGNEIRYNVYMANAITDAGKESAVLITPEPIIETQYVVTLGVEGKYLVGVSAVRLDNGEIVDESAINWSDTNGEYTPNPFGLRYYIPIPMPKNLR